MKFAAYARGWPSRDLRRCIDSIGALGYDGISASFQPDLGAPEGWSADERRELQKYAEDRGVQFASISLRLTALHDADPEARARQLALAQRGMQWAQDLECGCVEVPAGKNVAEAERPSARARLAESLIELGRKAADHGVSLAVAPEPQGLIATTGSLMELLESVMLPSVGTLYDQADLMLAGHDQFGEDFGQQRAQIKHCRIRDFVNKSETSPHWMPLGQGKLPWRKILRELQSTYYGGFVCYDYVRRGRPDLPPAEEELPRALEAMRQVVAQADAKTRG